MSTVDLLSTLMAHARMHAARVRADERGEVTEKVLITSIFAALAIAAGAIIVTKVIAKANGISTH